MISTSRKRRLTLEMKLKLKPDKLWRKKVQCATGKNDSDSVMATGDLRWLTSSALGSGARKPKMGHQWGLQKF